MIDQPLAVHVAVDRAQRHRRPLTSERRHLTPFSGDELVAFSARTLAAGLLSPA